MAYPEQFSRHFVGIENRTAQLDREIDHLLDVLLVANHPTLLSNIVQLATVISVSAYKAKQND